MGGGRLKTKGSKKQKKKPEVSLWAQLSQTKTTRLKTHRERLSGFDDDSNIQRSRGLNLAKHGELKWLFPDAQIFQEVDVHFASVAIPGSRPPRFGADVNVAIAIDVTDLQFVTA